MVLTDEEIEQKQKMEYQAYLNDEYSFLRELGIVKEEEEALPDWIWTLLAVNREYAPPPTH